MQVRKAKNIDAVRPEINFLTCKENSTQRTSCSMQNLKLLTFSLTYVLELKLSKKKKTSNGLIQQMLEAKSSCFLAKIGQIAIV